MYLKNSMRIELHSIVRTVKKTTNGTYSIFTTSCSQKLSFTPDKKIIKFSISTLIFQNYKHHRFWYKSHHIHVGYDHFTERIGEEIDFGFVFLNSNLHGLIARVNINVGLKIPADWLDFHATFDLCALGGDGADNWQTGQIWFLVPGGFGASWKISKKIH